MEQLSPSQKTQGSNTVVENPMKGMLLLNKLLSPYQKSSSRLNTRGGKSPVIDQSVLFKYALNHTKLKIEPCSCPHVLVADDDAFQHFYYQNLFQRSLDFGDSTISRENFRIKLCFSGEDLLEKIKAIDNCGCKSLLLVITDFSMGDTKLDGVETSIKVREMGYKGTLLLRTSEPKEYLKTKYKEFDEMLSKGVINMFIDKSDLKNAKEVIQTFLTNGKDS